MLPGDAIWWHQAITKTSVAISGVLGHSPQTNFTESAQDIMSENEFGKYGYKIASTSLRGQWVNTLRPRQNGRHFPDDIFKCIFLNENEWISLRISLKFVPKVRINNIPSLVQIMAWRRPGDKPLSEPIMVSLPTHICVTRPQWVNLQINHARSQFSPILFNMFLSFSTSDWYTEGNNCTDQTIFNSGNT